MVTDCLTCEYNQNPTKSPGGWIKEYKYWILEHTNEPIPINGWLVLKTKRHTEGVVGINSDESSELGTILDIVPKILKELTDSEMVYILCLTEKVKHLHFQLIPRYKTQTRLGLDLLKLCDEVKEGKIKPVDISEVIKLTESLRKRLEK